MTKISSQTQSFIEKENKHSAHNYHPLPVVLKKGRGVFVWDVEDKKYYDFLAAYSAVNQGHSHPMILDALKNQAEELTLTSRAFHNDKFGEYANFVTQYFGYDKVLPMNSGAEAVETGIKLMRKWGYEVKGIPAHKAKIVVCEHNFHGRTSTIVSFSNDPDAFENYGPYMPGFIRIPYNDAHALEKTLEQHAHEICGFLVEPIQGEAGVNVPDEGYLRQCYDICQKHEVLLAADEVQTGIARTGKLLAVDYEGIKPDVLILGKALSGGFYPVSAVLANDAVMKVIKPGQHGSTFGGNPLACAITMAALTIVKEEELAKNAFEQGAYFREQMAVLIDAFDLFKSVRGRGLMNALLINDAPDSSTAWEFCLEMKNNGLLAKPTHGNIIRFSPPLVITKEQIDDCISIIRKSAENFKQN